MCAECECLLHVSCCLEHISLCGDVIDEIDEGSLGDAWCDRRTVFEFAMVSEYAVNDEIDFAFFDTLFAQESVEVVCRHIDMSEQVHILLSFAFGIVFTEFSPVVEKDCYDDAFYLDFLGVRIYGIESFEQVEHLPSVVEESAREGMVNACSCRILAVWFVESGSILVDDGSEFFVFAEGEQLTNGILPLSARYWSRNEFVERMILSRKLPEDDVELSCGLLPLIVTNVEESDELNA